jgi:metallo-beta-lactamase class B
MQVTEGGKTYEVVIIGSPNVNPSYKLVNNTSYPQIAEDYERMWRVLKSLPCDIFLGALAVTSGWKGNTLSCMKVVRTRSSILAAIRGL